MKKAFYAAYIFEIAWFTYIWHRYGFSCALCSAVLCMIVGARYTLQNEIRRRH